MDLTIKNKSGVPTLTLQEDFNVFMRINFSAVCKAIALRGKVLKELTAYLKKDSNAWDTIIRIIRSSSAPKTALIKIQEGTGMSEETAQYLLGLELSESSSYYDLPEVEKMIKDYQEQLADVFTTVQKENN